MQDDFMKAEEHIRKALSLDYSIPFLKVQQKYNGSNNQSKIDEEEDLSLYQRPYDRYLTMLRDKIKLKNNVYNDPKNVIEKVIFFLFIEYLL